MSSVPSVLSESYEDVLNAVEESARGRWFLQEFASRVRSTENKSVLDAIHKLEAVVTGLPAQNTPGPESAKIKEAFEAVRRQIASVNVEGKKLSEEGQVFSHLADLARSSLSSKSQEVRPEVAYGIETALRIVQNIENEIKGIVPSVSPSIPLPELKGQTARPQAETQKYFQQDADMFAPPSTAANKQQQGEKSAQDEAAPKGAKLRVFKIDSRENAAPDMEATSAAPADGGHIAAAEHAAPENKPRITIIRRRPEELQQVPLAESEPSENAA